MTSKNRQRGMSMWALLGVLIVIGFVALMGVRLLPVYMDYWSVASVAESIREDTGPDDTMPEIWEKVRTRFSLNNLRELEPRETMKIRRRERSIEVHVNYEVRRPVFGNVDVVVKFDRKFGS